MSITVIAFVFLGHMISANRKMKIKKTGCLLLTVILNVQLSAVWEIPIELSDTFM